MFTGRPPFPEHITIIGVILAVSQGQRPARPVGVTDEVWEVIHANWDYEPLRRLSARETVGRLRALRERGTAGEDCVKQLNAGDNLKPVRAIRRPFGERSNLNYYF